MKDTDDDPIPTSDFSGQKPQKDVPLTVRRRINWSDSDTAEIAYTGSFIPIAIDALEIWYEAVLGTTFYDLKRNNMGSPAVSLHFDFHSPIVVGERLDIAVFVEKLGRTSVTHRFQMTKVGGGLVCQRVRAADVGRRAAADRHGGRRRVRGVGVEPAALGRDAIHALQPHAAEDVVERAVLLHPNDDVFDVGEGAVGGEDRGYRRHK